jgi:hypothetical protein
MEGLINRSLARNRYNKKIIIIIIIIIKYTKYKHYIKETQSRWLALISTTQDKIPSIKQIPGSLSECDFKQNNDIVPGEKEEEKLHKNKYFMHL